MRSSERGTTPTLESVESTGVVWEGEEEQEAQQEEEEEGWT